MQELQKADYVALAAFRQALRRFLAFSETALREKGVTPQQHQALLAIKASPEEQLSIGQLAEALLLQPHSCVELADRLEDAGLAVRVQATDDRRKVLLKLTPRAEELWGALAAVHVRELTLLRPELIEALHGLGRRD